jgi:hypothetical protein
MYVSTAFMKMQYFYENNEKLDEFLSRLASFKPLRSTIVSSR